MILYCFILVIEQFQATHSFSTKGSILSTPPSKLSASASTTYLLLSLLALSGCFNSDRNEMLSVGKCIKAGSILGDGELVAAGEHKLESSLSQIRPNARESMELGQELEDELRPAGSSTNSAHVLKVANKWKSSSYCDETLKGFRAHIKDLAAIHSKSIEPSEAPDSCRRYIAQYGMAYYAYAKPFSKELNDALKKSTEFASMSLKDYQREHVRNLIGAGKLDAVARPLTAACEGGGAVSDKIKSIQLIRELESPRTNALAKYIQTHAEDSDCGDLQDVYCRAHLIRQAAKIAYSTSRQCDQDEAPADVCAMDEQELVGKEFRELELVALNQAKKKYDDYIAAPRKYNPNTNANVNLLSEKCKKNAVIVLKLKNDAYYSYAKRVCEPEALEEFLRPEKELLNKINARLATLVVK